VGSRSGESLLVDAAVPTMAKKPCRGTFVEELDHRRGKGNRRKKSVEDRRGGEAMPKSKRHKEEYFFRSDKAQGRLGRTPTVQSEEGATKDGDIAYKVIVTS